jgi:redox-sensitive bicupin YhaK (pirin superfamily)
LPAIQPDRLMVLPRVPEPPAGPGHERPVASITSAYSTLEGAGFPVHRPFPAPGISLRQTDPFLLLDQMGHVEYAPGEARGAPWHPHRGFETVTYMLDGTMVHHDSNGGGGVIGEGATQWMTAGAGILHDEMPSEAMVRHGGVMHGVQLWVNLPARLKWTAPRYQAIEADRLLLLASSDGGSVLRVIAGEVAGHRAPGVTWTPIDLIHASLSPGARLRLAWRRDFSAMAYTLAGRGRAGAEERPLGPHQLAVFGPGDALTLRADDRQEGPADALEVLILGGLPIREPIYHYGPFVMNSYEEIVQAVEDYQRGRMGRIPATTIEAAAATADGRTVQEGSTASDAR